MQSSKGTYRGFTIVELLIVMAIMVVLVSISIAPLSHFRSTALIDQTKSDIISALTEARNLTLSSRDNTIYGVHFETSKVVMFKGSTYFALTPGNKVYELGDRVSITGINLSSGGAELTFRRLTGEASKTGTIVYRVNSDSGIIATTTILSSGIIE